MKLKDARSLEEELWHLESILKSRGITLPTKVRTVKAMVSSVVIYTCESWTIRFGCRSTIDLDQRWALKNWCFWTVMLEKTLESPLDCKKIKLVNPKGNQPWIFTGKTNAEVKGQYFWPPDAKSRLVGKDPDGRKDWRQEGKGATEDEMVGWHHWLNGHEFEQTQGDSEVQGSLTCCSPWGCKESNTTEQLNWTDFISNLHNNLVIEILSLPYF